MEINDYVLNVLNYKLNTDFNKSVEVNEIKEKTTICLGTLISKHGIIVHCHYNIENEMVEFKNLTSSLN